MSDSATPAPAQPTATPAVPAATPVAATAPAAPAVTAPAATPAPATSAPVTPAATPAVPVTLLTPAPTADQVSKDGKPQGATPVPADIEIKIPEGVVVAPKLLEGFKAFAKANNISSENAQKYVDQYVEQQKEMDLQQQEKVLQWAEQARADKEYGGVQFESNVKIGLRAIAKFGTPELAELLGKTGLGNNPEFMRFAIRVGKTIQEDRLPGSGDVSPGEVKDMARALYPTMFKD